MSGSRSGCGHVAFKHHADNPLCARADLLDTDQIAAGVDPRRDKAVISAAIVIVLTDLTAEVVKNRPIFAAISLPASLKTPLHAILHAFFKIRRKSHKILFQRVKPSTEVTKFTVSHCQ